MTHYCMQTSGSCVNNCPYVMYLFRSQLGLEISGSEETVLLVRTSSNFTIHSIPQQPQWYSIL